MSGQTHYYVIGAVELVLAFVVMFFAESIAKPGDEEMARKIGLVIGGLLGLKGFAMIAAQLLRTPQEIILYGDRIEEKRGEKIRKIPLDQIAAMKLQEFYEHRFAPQTYNVTLEVRGDSNLKFSTALGGDADKIVEYLAEIVPDVQVREFMA
jgi:hypothetical protein